MKKIIFFHPQKIVDNPKKGSELRPKKMIEAFETIGFTVDLVVGDSLQRKKAMKQVKREILNGTSYDFLYAESSNMPVPFTDSHHIPLRPFQDYFFFKMLNKHKIPIGLFYRDVYWRDEQAQKKFDYFKRETKKILHKMEWFGIRKTVNHLFLPTIGMSKYLPHKWQDDSLNALYPGCELNALTKGTVKKDKTIDSQLNIFYVGGIKLPYYNLRPMIKIIEKVEGVKLILCCRESEWNEFSYYYHDFAFNNVEVIHADSKQIGKYYNQSDIVLDLRAPEGYLKNTIPIKIIEAIGYEVPVLLLEGTEYAAFVKKEETGWVVENLTKAKELLEELRDNKHKIAEKKADLRKIAEKHTWEKRAEQAATVLTNSNKKQ